MINSASPQDTFDHIIGAGALTYSWWVNYSIENDETPQWKATITVEDGNGGEKTFTVDHEVVMNTAKKIIADYLNDGSKPKFASDVMVGECANLLFNADNTDFDASDSDELLQIIAFGEVVFG